MQSMTRSEVIDNDVRVLNKRQGVVPDARSFIREASCSIV